MAIPSNSTIISAVKSALTSKGFDFDKAPKADEFITDLVGEIVDAIKQADVSTTVASGQATTCPAGAGSTTTPGSGSGGIS